MHIMHEGIIYETKRKTYWKNGVGAWWTLQLGSGQLQILKNQGAKTTQIPVRYGDWPWLFTSTYSTITQQPGLLIVPSIKILRQAQKVFLKNGIQQSLNRANYEVGEVWNGLIWLLKGQFTKMHILTVPIWIDTTMPRERTCLKKRCIL